MTITLLQLWMPILLGTVLAWIASALIHVVAKYHNSDYQPLSNEEEVMTAVRNGSPTLGIHTLPYCTEMSEMNKPEVQEKFNKGPVAILTVFSKRPAKHGQANAATDRFFPAWLHIDCVLHHSGIRRGSGLYGYISLCVYRRLSCVWLGHYSDEYLVRTPLVDHREIPAGRIDL